MNVISHIAYPVLAAQSANIFRTQRRREVFFKWKQLLLIGLCGGLPDILSPHLGLEARYNSFSHSLMFVFLIAILSILLAWKIPQHKKLIYFCCFAVMLHLVGDMLANGINLLGPWGRMVVGTSLIRSQYWMSLDATGALFLFVSMIYYKCPVRARSVFLLVGFILALCGAVIFFTILDTETILIKKIPNSQIDAAQLNHARQVWDKLQSKWKAKIFEALPDDFDVGLRQGATPQKQKEIYNQIKNVFGEYQGMTFVEAKTGRFYYPRRIYYRFKGAYSQMPQQPEIVIIFGHNGKITSFMFRDYWKSKLM